MRLILSSLVFSDIYQSGSVGIKPRNEPRWRSMRDPLFKTLAINRRSAGLAVQSPPVLKAGKRKTNPLLKSTPVEPEWDNEILQDDYGD